MPPRVPLLWPVYANISQLDVAGTNTATGYDPDLRESYITDVANVRTDSLVYKTAILVPCQVEVRNYEDLQAEFGGDAPVTNMILVFHRRDLQRLGLINSTTRNAVLKQGDRINHLERSGHSVKTPYAGPLYIYELRPASWGFGPDGYDLELAFLLNRPATAVGR